MSSELAHQSQQHQQVTPRANQAPRVVLAKGLLRLIYEYVAAFLQARGQDAETGGMLTGEFVNAADGVLFRLRGFIGAGPEADCSAESVLFDGEYQSRMLELTLRRHPRAGNMGCIHLHPEQMDLCSEKDWLADVEAVRASDTKVLVFAIITINNRRPDPLSLRYRNFKFDFFVLGEQTGFEYVHVRPTIEPLPLIETEPEPASPFAMVNGEVLPGRHFASCPKMLKDKRRLVAEVRAMEERYGGQATLKLEGSRLYWEYTVVESGRRFPIQVCYPRRYPLDPPRILSVLPLPTSPHQLPGNELCWTNRSDVCDWNPARDTAATCILAAHRWFACLLVYLTLGKWPAEADDGLQFAA